MKSVLLVDDYEEGLIWMEEILTKEGYRIKSCNNALDALNELNKKHYDIVVTDIVMQGMNGIEFIEEIRKLQDKEQLDKIGIIIITGKTTELRARKALKLKVYDYLLRTDAHEVLAKVVEKYFNEHTDEDQVIKAMENVVKTSSNPDRKFFSSGGATLSPREMLKHLKEGDELGLRIRRAIISLSVEFMNRERKTN